MKIYLADTSIRNFALANQGMGESACTKDHKVRRILISYHYFKNKDLGELLANHFTPPYPDVFLDSGAFSAFSQGVSIALSAYCDYIHRFRHLLTVYSNLDVIGSAAGTLANQKRMEKEGLSPLPVFHVGEEWKYIECYLSGYAYIALGGMVPYNMNSQSKRLFPWLVKCFKLAANRTVFHGFGCTSWGLVKSFPWYSVDSSTWNQSYKWGKPLLFDDRIGNFVEIHLGDSPKCYLYAPLFRSLGFDPADFADRSRNERKKIAGIAALSFMHAEQWLERRHGVVTIPERTVA